MIRQIPHFLSKAFSVKIIKACDGLFKTASTLGGNDPNYRIADYINFTKTHKLFNTLTLQIEKVTGYPRQNQESPQIIRYYDGGEYRVHHDFFHPGQPYYEQSIVNAGQRIITCLIYLNDDFDGGETSFPIKNIKVTPEIGKLVIWRNITNDGKLNYDSLHAGLPVKNGVKYILVIWIRERSWGN